MQFEKSKKENIKIADVNMHMLSMLNTPKHLPKICRKLSLFLDMKCEVVDMYFNCNNPFELKDINTRPGG